MAVTALPVPLPARLRRAGWFVADGEVEQVYVLGLRDIGGNLSAVVAAVEGGAIEEVGLSEIRLKVDPIIRIAIGAEGS